MHARRFYPRQVARRLHHRTPESLSAGEQAALRFFLKKGRKMRVGMWVAQADTSDLSDTSLEGVSRVLAEGQQRIHVYRG